MLDIRVNTCYTIYIRGKERRKQNANDSKANDKTS